MATRAFSISICAVLIALIQWSPAAHGLNFVSRHAEPSAHSSSRPFVCPDCHRSSMGIIAGLRFPPDGYDDEIMLQAVDCNQCSFRGVGAYTENRQGRETRFHHWGYRITQSTYDGLVQEMQGCPDADQIRCRCDAHVRYGRLNGHSWDGIHVVPHDPESFKFKLAE